MSSNLHPSRLNLTRETVSTLLMVLPYPMATVYFLLAGRIIAIPSETLLIHYVIVTFWTISTILLVAFSESLLRGQRYRRFTALVPTLSNTVLFFLYASAITGLRNWGHIPDWKILRASVPNILSTGKAVGIPAWAGALLLATPPLITLFLHVAAHPSARNKALLAPAARTATPRSFARQLRIYLLCWTVAGLFLYWETPLPTWLPGEPVLGLFATPMQGFPMTPDRIHWADQDSAARLRIVRNRAKLRTIVVFVIDSLRADHLPFYGYSRNTAPYLTEFATKPEGHAVKFALANSNESLGGVLAIATSKNTSAISTESYTLADYLADQGFKTSFFLSDNHNWYGLRTLYGDRIDQLIDGADRPTSNGIADDKMLVESVENLPHNDGSNHLFWFHMMSVHDAGFLYREHSSNWPDESPKQTRTERAINRYDCRIRQADAIIRQITRTLQQKGYLDSYIAIVTADHGQLLGENQVFGHGRSMCLPAIQIPMLFFSSSPLAGLFQSDTAVQIDIAPTLVRLAGLEVPDSWQGVSLLDPARPRTTFHSSVLNRSTSEKAIMLWQGDSIIKYTCRPKATTDSLHEQVSEIRSDPLEKHDLLRENALPESIITHLRQLAPSL